VYFQFRFQLPLILIFVHDVRYWSFFIKCRLFELLTKFLNVMSIARIAWIQSGLKYQSIQSDIGLLKLDIFN